MKKSLLLIILIFSLPCFKVFSQETDYKSYTLFIYNFMKYIEWPSNNTQGDFIIGVVGESAIVTELEKLSQTKKIKNRNIVIKKFQNLNELANCHLVYIPPNKSSMLKEIITIVQGKPVLLIAEREGLAKKGAAFSFVIEEDDILKFEVNKTIIEKQQLKIPSVLLSLGSVVST